MDGGHIDHGPADIERASRVLAQAGHAGMPFGGVVARAGNGALLATPRGLGLDEVVASRVTPLASLDALAPAPRWVRAAHALLAARSDLGAVVHTHALHAVALSTRAVPLRALSHEGCHLVPPEVPRLAEIEPVVVVAALARAPVCLVHGHGLLATAATLGEAVALAIYLERTCAMNLLAAEVSAPAPDSDVLAKRRGQLSRPAMSWRYLARAPGIGGRSGDRASVERTL